MSAADVDSLFRELKPDVESLANPLFAASRKFIRARGAFLPHGAVLSESGEVRLVMALPPDGEERPVSTIEVLPLLHDALRQAARTNETRAVAVCEDVRIGPSGAEQQPAIKVLIEHRRGLCVALYMPFRKRMLPGYRFGQIVVQPASAEINSWGDPAGA